MKSTFLYDKTTYNILKSGRILAKNEMPPEMIERVVKAVFKVEKLFGTENTKINNLMDDFCNYLDNHYCVMSTPILTNAGKYHNRPLSACTVPDIDVSKNPIKYRNAIEVLHKQGMGTGFNLDICDDPVAILKVLNEIALKGANSGNENRPVGNMAILSANHPKILEFIDAKRNSDIRCEDWKFNISINVNEQFFQSIESGNPYFYKDGTRADANTIFNRIIEAAYYSADPGIIFLDRLNSGNPTPGLAKYVSTAPCAEVGLAPGETCQFGYLNIGKFVREKNNTAFIDLAAVVHATQLMTRVLDNALEISKKNFRDVQSRYMLEQKRKIGIGVCGIADALYKLHIPYDSENGRKKISEILALINYTSKTSSHNLAKDRGSFGFMKQSIGNKYYDECPYIEDRFSDNMTEIVSKDDWIKLSNKIKKSGFLRNATTIALPPTGRSGLIINASTGIEPQFSLLQYNGKINSEVMGYLNSVGLWGDNIKDTIERYGSIQDVPNIPDTIKAIYKTATEIAPLDHIKMVHAAQLYVDDAVSKTINIPEQYSIDDTRSIFIEAYKSGLRGMTIYRQSVTHNQPRSLSK